MPSRATVILNSLAGADRKGPSPRELADLFAAAGVDATIVTATGPEIAAAARQALTAGADTIVAAGGDGTVSTVAVGRRRRHRAALGIVPLGTLNHFAGTLHIPTSCRRRGACHRRRPHGRRRCRRRQPPDVSQHVESRNVSPAGARTRTGGAERPIVRGVAGRGGGARLACTTGASVWRSVWTARGAWSGHRLSSWGTTSTARRDQPWDADASGRRVPSSLHGPGHDAGGRAGRARGGAGRASRDGRATGIDS